MFADDYYALLGLTSDADDEDIRRAWRKLALELHPDRAGVDSTAQFQRISVAYSVLSDSDARAAYDRRHGITRTPASPIRRAPGVMIRRLSASLDQLLARGVARIADDNVIELFVDDHEAKEGGMVTISMRVRILCTSCPPDGTCSVCGGARTVEDVYAAWLAVRPGVEEGTILTPSARMPGMVRPVTFRVRLP
ncbi:MAG: DnaJ domain-containing protein, partial [Kofleriaceae bacterium]|nr:DnaJ domain-containing protein [Kofleriaceae bacterium]